MGIAFQQLEKPEEKQEGPLMENSETLNLTNNWVWVVVRIDEKLNKDGVHDWHLQGIAADETLAIGMCADETYLIGPLPFNTALPRDKIEWVGAYFPLKQK